MWIEILIAFGAGLWIGYRSPKAIEQFKAGFNSLVNHEKQKIEEKRIEGPR